MIYCKGEKCYKQGVNIRFCHHPSHFLKFFNHLGKYEKKNIIPSLILFTKG